MKRYLSLSCLLGLFSLLSDAQELRTCDRLDYNNYSYDLLEVGGDCWFAENLRSISFSDGSLIPRDDEEVLLDSDCAPLAMVYGGSVGGERLACSHSCTGINACNESVAFSVFGLLYNWCAVNHQGGLCPSGWHVPRVEEWRELLLHLESESGEKGSQGTGHLRSRIGWANRSNGSNSSGLNLKPGGWWSNGEECFSAGYFGVWWSSSSSSDTTSWNFGVSAAEDGVPIFHELAPKGGAYSVRCIRN
jgi:uncharacterized protein (TIGR02145 family)